MADNDLEEFVADEIDEIEIEELDEFPAEGEIAALARPARTDLLIFEGVLSASQQGVRGCAGRAPGLVEHLVDRYAAEKASETGLTPFWKGHSGGNVYVRTYRRRPGGGRKCRITVHLKPVVMFERPA